MIENFLGCGVENAQSFEKLKELTGCTVDRTLFSMLENARKRNVPVVSDGKNGYFIAETPEEIDHYLRLSNAKAFTILRNNAIVRERMVAMVRKEQFEGRTLESEVSHE